MGCCCHCGRVRLSIIYRVIGDFHGNVDNTGEGRERGVGRRGKTRLQLVNQSIGGFIRVWMVKCLTFFIDFHVLKSHPHTITHRHTHPCQHTLQVRVHVFAFSNIGSLFLVLSVVAEDERESVYSLLVVGFSLAPITSVCFLSCFLLLFSHLKNVFFLVRN